jgi:hypothetical protein
VPSGPDALAVAFDEAVNGLPIECVKASMLRRAQPVGGIYYGRCDSSEGRATTSRVKPPCLSDNYVNYVYRAYRQAMRCTGLDPKELFGLVTQETKFQVNIGNSGGAWGAAQMVGIAVADIDRNHRFAELEERPECARFAALFERSRARAGFTGRTGYPSQCERIHMPENPAETLVYGATLFKTYRAAAERELRRHGLRFASDRDRARIVREITLAMYNGGDAGVKPALRVLLRRLGSMRIGHDRFKNEFRAEILAHYGDGLDLFGGNEAALADKRLQVVGYAPAIAALERSISSETGRECAL